MKQHAQSFGTRTLGARAGGRARLAWLASVAALVAMMGFLVTSNLAAANGPDEDVEAGAMLSLDLGLDVQVGDLVDLNASGEGEAEASASVGVDVVDNVDACIGCEDALIEATVVGSGLVDGTEVHACVLGSCDDDTTSATDGAVITVTTEGGEDTRLLNDTNAQICVLAGCGDNAEAAARILVNSAGTGVGDGIVGPTSADICVLGDCTGNGGTDGVVGTVGTGTNTTIDSSVDGTVCILADCSTSDGNTDSDGTDETGSQAIVNDPGTDNGVPGNGSISEPGMGGDDGLPGGEDESSTTGIPGEDDAQSGDDQQGLPLAGFAPIAEHPLPVLALLALVGAWLGGAYLIRRHA